MSDDDLIRRGDALALLPPASAYRNGIWALPAATGWQDISTAPENLTVIWFGGSAGAGSIGRFKRNTLRMDDSRWPSWWGGAWVSDIKKDPATWPTHWQPLPGPPS
jgi:hypothetical protein